jgi:hypothetical protein
VEERRKKEEADRSKTCGKKEREKEAEKKRKGKKYMYIM